MSARAQDVPEKNELNKKQAGLKRKSSNNVSDEEDGSYDMSKKGYAVLFNQIFSETDKERHGTEMDVIELKKCLNKLNFDVHAYKDLNLDQIEYVMDEVRKLRNKSCVIIVLMTHGGKANQVKAVDKHFNADILWKDMQKELSGIPKLFFLQACRGNVTDIGYTSKSGDIETDGGEITDSAINSLSIQEPFNSDILKLFASHEDYYSYRNKETGSYLIQEMCKVFEKYAATKNIMDLLTIVCRNVAIETIAEKYKQMPQFETTLTKNLKFNVTNEECVLPVVYISVPDRDTVMPVSRGGTASAEELETILSNYLISLEKRLSIEISSLKENVSQYNKAVEDQNIKIIEIQKTIGQSSIGESQSSKSTHSGPAEAQNGQKS